jgi:Transposase DDE domain/Domain of unknown function (DUF4372)
VSKKIWVEPIKILPAEVNFSYHTKIILMSKSKFFTGQPIFAQILSFVPKSDVDRIARETKSDRYCRHFTTHCHLVSILYAVFNNCNSIRELTTGMLAWEQRITHLGMGYFPRRSTLSDANSRRSEEVFGQIYEFVYNKHKHLLPDSRKKKSRNLYVADSSTITLFQEIMEGAGRQPVNGKRKGGVKVHTLMKSDEDVPCMVRMTASAKHDSSFLKELKLPPGSILVFDKGYNDYKQYQRFSNEKITWVTRVRESAVYEVIEALEVSQWHKSRGITRDTVIVLGHDHHNNNTRVNARLINFKDPRTGNKLSFITNNTQLASTTITSIYKQRWQIETLFKRLKQNYPLKYFLGDSQNAIKIQIWCSLIADLLVKIVKSVAAKKWSFSNLKSIIRIHLMTYIDLYSFLRNPDNALEIKTNKQIHQHLLFPP